MKQNNIKRVDGIIQNSWKNNIREIDRYEIKP